MPQIGEEEVQAVVRVLRSGMLTSGLGAGPEVTKLEQSFSKLCGVKHAVAVNTGTAALHAAIMACGVKRDDEVILPSFTFVATAEAVVLAGAKPVFADIDPETYNLSHAAVEKAISKKTKAILPVDFYGLCADMKPMREIAQKNGVALSKMLLKRTEQLTQENLQEASPMRRAGVCTQAKTSPQAKED